MIKFYDTCSLLLAQESAFGEFFAISDVTLRELEGIKTSRFKTEDVKYQARKLSKMLRDYDDMYKVVVLSGDLAKNAVNNDEQIVLCAKHFSEQTDEEVVFVTDDICAYNLASKIYGMNVCSVFDFLPNDNYKGFVEVVMSEAELGEFLEHLDYNKYNLLTNEYLVIWDESREYVDAMRWDGTKHVSLIKKNIKTDFFDKLKTKDIFQAMVVDSILNNQITAITGKAGSGKSLLSLMVAMYLVKTGAYDRIVILYNAVKVRGAADIGFLPGSSDEKILGGALGNQLNSKFGDRFAIDLLLQQDKLRIVSMGDCRGMEIGNEILYIPEAENTSIDLMKICLSRASDNAKVIVEGDYKQQVDSLSYDGENNGLKRIIDVFKGEDIFGYVELQNIWRSRLANLCEKL